MDLTHPLTRRQIHAQLLAHVADFAAMFPIPPGPELDYPIEGVGRLVFATGPSIVANAAKALDALFIEKGAKKWSKAEEQS